MSAVILVLMRNKIYKGAFINRPYTESETGWFGKVLHCL